MLHNQVTTSFLALRNHHDCYLFSASQLHHTETVYRAVM